MNLSYDEIILQIRKNNKEAFGLLFSLLEKSVGFFYSKIRYVYHIFDYDKNDVFCMIWEETINLVKKYSFDKGNFFSYWTTAITHYINHLVKKESYDISINKNRYDLESTQYILKEAEKAKDDYESFVDYHDYEFALEKLEKEYDSKKIKLFKLWAQGYSYVDIAKMYNIKPSNVLYVVHKLLKGLKDILK